MKEFLSRYELVWILPLSFLVSILSVFGLSSFNEAVAGVPTKLIPLEEATGYSTTSPTYCTSYTLVEHAKSFKSMQEVYNMVIFEVSEVEDAYVSIETHCSDSSTHVYSYIGEGFRVLRLLKESN